MNYYRLQIRFERWLFRGTVLLCLLISACSGAGPGPYAPQSVANSAERMQHSQRVVMLDGNVQDVLLLVGSDQRRLPGGEIYVRTNFQNRLSQEDVWAEVKLQFLDADNFPVDETEWIKYRFPALEVTTVQGSSISNRAVKHVMLIKNLYTSTGRPIKAGTTFKIPGFSRELPK